MTQERAKRTRQRARAKREAARPAVPAASIEAVEAALGYQFRDRTLIERALTHPSAISAQDPRHLSNQRLEFLGDRVLGLVMADHLFERHANADEGELTPRFHRLVTKPACAAAVRPFALGQHMLVDRGQSDAESRDRDSLLGDAAEAVLGAVFRDGGLKAAREVVLRLWKAQLDSPPGKLKSPKTRLQEIAQGKGMPTPTYREVERGGPAHAPVFTMEAMLEDGRSARASGGSKGEAERLAAQKLLSEMEGGA